MQQSTYFLSGFVANVAIENLFLVRIDEHKIWMQIE